MNIVFDIETVGVEFEELSESQQEFILRYAEKEHDEKLREEKIDDAKRFLSLYPLTARTVAIGMLRTDTEGSVILFDGTEEQNWENEEKNIKYWGMSESEMLTNFWEFASKADKTISFNGRAFDVPFLLIRSAINKIKPTINLLGNRYSNKRHVDLLEEFTFHGLTKKFNLDFYCQAFGIESPKSHGVTGMEVKELYKAGRIDDIAIYCGNDILATFELFKIWNEFLNFNSGNSHG